MNQKNVTNEFDMRFSSDSDQSELQSQEDGSTVDQVRKNNNRRKKPVEWFSGSDPVFNLPNAKLRWQHASKFQIFLACLPCIILAAIATAVAFWFNLVIQHF